MKIQCDVCSKEEASVFCIADEAALCAACDHRVHHANKLAGKHHRFSLHHSSPDQGPRCDICQERMAFLFCQQDRAILCRECDISIHKANEHTQKHARFLLTGVKLSSTSSLYSSSQESPKNVSVDNKKPLPTNTNSTFKSTTTHPGLGSGWHVEDLLDSSFPSQYGFCKNGDDDGMPFWDAGLESNISGFPSENKGFWVPQVPTNLNQTQNQSFQSMDFAFGIPNGTKEFSSHNIKSSRKGNEDSSFLVPQISPTFSASKRSRTSW